MSVNRSVFVTGATGFIGSHLTSMLLDRGYEVTALVRGSSRRLPASAGRVRGDLLDPGAYRWALRRSELVIHLAADYRLGPVDRRQMYRINVAGTACLLDAAIEEGVRRVVHVSSTAALGETHGFDADESHRHNGSFRSYYEQTKHIAHGIAAARMRRGAPIVIAIPGGVTGPGDRSALARTLGDVARGRLPVQIDSSSRFNLCPVEALCDGLLRVAERGEAGRSYVLAGTNVSMREIVSTAAAAVGTRPPRPISPGLLRPIAAVLDAVARISDRELPVSREALRALDGSTYTYSSARARAELGWSAPPIWRTLVDLALREAGRR